MGDLKPIFKQINTLKRTASIQRALLGDTERRRLFVSLGLKAIRVALSARYDQSSLSVLESAVLGEDLFLDPAIDALPDSFFEEPTAIGWAYQILNAEARDANSWAVSKKGDNRSEDVDIAAVTQVFTDEYIADFLSSRCIDLLSEEKAGALATLKICDPAVGTGHILISAAKNLFSRGLHPDDVAFTLYGFDIDPIAVDLARVQLLVLLLREGFSGSPIDLWQILCKQVCVLPEPYGTLNRKVNLAYEMDGFDIVVTNPPYLGKRKLPNAFREFLDRHYPAASADICAAFMWRCVELLKPRGALGLITSDKWIRLSSYQGLRTGDGIFKGLLGELTIDGIYELGSRAFDSVAELHDGMKAAILTARREYPTAGHVVSYVTLSALSDRDAKRKALIDSLDTECSSPYLIKIRQSELAKGGAVFLKTAGLPLKFAELFQQAQDKARVVVGVQTSDDAQFVRYVWQAPADREGWRVHCKGGGYARWAGLNRWIINWRAGQDLFFGSALARERSERWVNSEGWVYSWLANGSLGLRYKTAGTSFGRAAAGAVFPEDNRLAAYLNSRLASAAVRSIGGKIQLPEGIVKSIPTPVDLSPISGELVEWVIRMREQIVASDPREATFNPGKLLSVKKLLVLEALILVGEAKLEQQVEQSVGLSLDEREALQARLGPVVGWFEPGMSLVEHPIFAELSMEYKEFFELLIPDKDHSCVKANNCPSFRDLAAIERLSDIESRIDSGWLLPSTGPVEIVCRAFRIHPFDALVLIDELLKTSRGVNNELYLPRLGVDLITKLGEIFGHRWWSDKKEIQVGKKIRITGQDLIELARAQADGEDYLNLEKSELDAWSENRFIPWQHKLFYGVSPFLDL